MAQVTIKEIAEKAGVSIATVSRAINGDYPVGTETRQRIERAIDELGYRPNAIARSLRSRKTNLLAFIVPDMANAFFMEIAKGIETEINQKGYSLVVASSDGDPQKERKVISTLMEKRLDGIFIASSDTDDLNISGICNSFDTAAILIDRPLPNSTLPKVVWNDRGDCEKLTDYLIACGHTDIGMVNVCMENINGQNRYQGFLDSLKKNGLEANPEWISPSSFRREDSYVFSRELLSGKNRPTAVVCANNIMLQGFLKAAEEHNLRPGTDISVVCFGVPEFFYGLKVTGIKLESERMGLLAGNRMVSMLNDSRYEGQDIVLDTRIVEGDSVRNLK